MSSSRIEELEIKLEKLAEQEISIRRQIGDCVTFVQADDGTARQEIIDQAKFSSLSDSLKQVAATKVSIESKIEKLQQLYKDYPEETDITYLERLKAEFFWKSVALCRQVPMICPRELILLPEWLLLEKEYQPRIDSFEGIINRILERSRREIMILQEETDAR